MHQFFSDESKEKHQKSKKKNKFHSPSGDHHKVIFHLQTPL